MQWNAGTACVSECVLKTLACRGLHVGPSKVQGLRERWLEWVSGGRDEYHGAAAKSAVFDGQLQALRESLERQRELEKDEAWKVTRTLGNGPTRVSESTVSVGFFVSLTKFPITIS